MKNIVRGIRFWAIVIAFILGMLGIGEVLAKLITMKTIMTIVYIALGYSFIYIFKR